jgi:hypothetical protein
MRKAVEILLEVDHMLLNAEIKIHSIKDDIRKSIAENKTNELLELQLCLKQLYLSTTKVENVLLKIINEALEKKSMV